jgi:hypothetical protein
LLVVQLRGRIRDHFQEEHFSDTSLGRTSVSTKAVLEAVRWTLNRGQYVLLGSSAILMPKPFITGFNSSVTQKSCERSFPTQRPHRHDCGSAWAAGFGREEFYAFSVCGEAGHTLPDEGAIDDWESFIDATFLRPRVMREADPQ